MERLGERLLLENERVRVWEDQVPVSGQQAVHRHERPYLSVVIAGARGEIVGEDGEVRYAFHRTPGEVRYFGTGDLPVSHALRNTGADEIRVLVVELLDRSDPGNDAATSASVG